MLIFFHLLVDFKGKETCYEDQHVLACLKTFQSAFLMRAKAWLACLEVACLKDNVKIMNISLILFKTDDVGMDLQRKSSVFLVEISMCRW